MAHIALMITGLTGKLNASFEMASRLQKEGHQVTYLCPIDVRKKIEMLGFGYRQLPEINFRFSDPVYDQINSRGWLSKFVFHWKYLRDHYSRGKAILNLDAYKNALKEVEPDKVLVDMELHELVFTALDLKIPVTLFSSWFSNRMSLRLPPLRSAIIPNGNKLPIFIAWTKVRLRRWARLIVDKLTFRNYRRSTLLKYAREIGFDTNELVTSNFPPLFAYTKLPIVTITMRELDFPHKPYDNLTYLGPMVYEKRDLVNPNSELETDLMKIFKQRELGKKIVYCSLGSFKKADVHFLKKLISAVADISDLILVISLGKLIDSQVFDKIPSNVYVFDWLPQLEILQRSDCCINHGGTHTVYECLHFSVPMVVYSGKNFDQNGTAARISYHGIGLMGDKDTDSPERIRTKVEKVLSDTSYKNKMSKLNKEYLKYRELEIYQFLN